VKFVKDDEAELSETELKQYSDKMKELGFVPRNTTPFQTALAVNSDARKAVRMFLKAVDAGKENAELVAEAA
jgi:hypothetical protein